jgi:hypothetical protein
MHKLRSFFLKAFILALPLLLIMAVYVITDPFKVIFTYHFDNYYNWQHWEINRELAGVENLKQRLAKNDAPDAYIFGNSRSLTFRTDVWESFINDSTKPYHFDAASETLYGVYHKVKYLDSKDVKIKDALLVCDISLLSKTTNDHDVTHMKHPDVTGESRYAYQVNFIKGYFSNLFFLKQIDYLLFKKERKYMKDIFAIEKGYIRSEPYKNDYYYQKYDSMIRTDSVGYYGYKEDVFYDRPAGGQTSGPVLKDKQIAMLKEIKQVFDKDHTRCKVVISPLYDEMGLNKADVNILKSIFGDHAVYDYSGKNEITSCRCHYYESSHFKPYIANKIMSEIYAR